MRISVSCSPALMAQFPQPLLQLIAITTIIVAHNYKTISRNLPGAKCMDNVAIKMGFAIMSYAEKFQVRIQTMEKYIQEHLH